MPKIKLNGLYVSRCGSLLQARRISADGFTCRLHVVRQCGCASWDCREGSEWNYFTENGKWLSQEHDKDYHLHVAREILE